MSNFPAKIQYNIKTIYSANSDLKSYFWVHLYKADTLFSPNGVRFRQIPLQKLFGKEILAEFIFAILFL